MERKRKTASLVNTTHLSSVSFFFLLSICTLIFSSRITTASTIPCLDTKCPTFTKAHTDFQVQGFRGTHSNVSRQMHGLHRDYETHVVVVPSASPLLPSSLRRIKSPALNRFTSRPSRPFDENPTALGKRTFRYSHCAICFIKR
ncbi:hypothetical protein ACSQ67_017470 [Phaseolus vulgaris]